MPSTDGQYAQVAAYFLAATGRYPTPSSLVACHPARRTNTPHRQTSSLLLALVQFDGFCGRVGGEPKSLYLGPRSKASMQGSPPSIWRQHGHTPMQDTQGKKNLHRPAAQRASSTWIRQSWFAERFVHPAGQARQALRVWA
jgi:hypothetical protein